MPRTEDLFLQRLGDDAYELGRFSEPDAKHKVLTADEVRWLLVCGAPTVLAEQRAVEVAEREADPPAPPACTCDTAPFHREGCPLYEPAPALALDLGDECA